MKLTNKKEFEKWCEKNGFYAEALLNDIKEHAMNCAGTYGNSDISHEELIDEKIMPIDFKLVLPEFVEVQDEVTLETRKCFVTKLKENEIVIQSIDDPKYRFFG